MADNSKYIQAQKFSLAVGAANTDTSITLQSFNFPDGTAISASDLGSITYGTLEPGTTREEQISFTGVTTNADGTVTLTGVTRGLGFGYADTYSEQSDLKVQHGSGSTFIISNTAAFYDSFVNKRNDETITGTLSVPTPTSGAHAATKDYVDAASSGNQLSYDRIVVAGNAGESVAAGDLVYFDDTDNEWKKTTAATASTVQNVLLGIAQGSGSDGASISGGVLTHGLDSNQTGMTVGVKLYASDTAGDIAESAGTTEKVIGFSKSTTEVYFDPYFNYTITSDIQDSLAGAGATPNSTNKFLTEGDIDDNTIFIPPTAVVFASSGTWTKDAGLKYVVVEVVGGGGGSEGTGDAGAGAGGYGRKVILAASLGATETVTVGAGGAASGAVTGGTSSFGSHVTANGGVGTATGVPGSGGSASGGDLNVTGGRGTPTNGTGNATGGHSVLAAYGKGGNSNSAGNSGVVIVTEYYS